MDTKIGITEDLSNNIALQHENEFFTKGVTMKTNSNSMLLDDDYGRKVKIEIKSDTSFLHLYSQQERECCTKHVINQIQFENVTCSRNCKIHMKTEVEGQTLVSDFGSENKREYIPEVYVAKIKKCNSDLEMDSKIEIKEELCCLETETSSICDGIKDDDCPPLKPSRLCKEAISGDSHVKSSLLSPKVLGGDTNICNGKDCSECETEETDVAEMPTVKQDVYLEQSGKCTDWDICNRALSFEQNYFTHKGKMAQNCGISEKCFRCVSHLKVNEFLHGSKSSYNFKAFDRSFTQVSFLSKHNLVYEPKKPHQCKTCDKSFSRPSHLKAHNMIHEGRKLHECKTCGKSFSWPSDLKRHSLIHEGKKPHQCKTCNRSFTQLSSLKTHKFIHENKKPHQCKICDKRFTKLSSLKAHNFIHEGKKPHQCKTCDKSYTDLSTLKRHNLIHEGKKPHQCETCDKNFTQLSSLKTHNLIHLGKKPHQCETCGKSFTKLSNLKAHNLIHKGNKPHQCKTCGKSFTQLSNLNRHNLIHKFDKDTQASHL